MGLDDFTPERSYADWASDIEELPGLRVDVVPVGYEENGLETRGTVEYLCTADIAVRQWFAPSKRETNGRIKLSSIDRLIEFVQELNEFFCKENGRRLPAYPSAVWQKNNIRFTYSRSTWPATNCSSAWCGWATRSARIFHDRHRLQYTNQTDLSAATKAAFRNFGHCRHDAGTPWNRSCPRPLEPGTPPHTHTGSHRKGKVRWGNLQRAIAYDATKDDAIIGPRFSVVGLAGRAHELGEVFHGEEFDERAFMGPALDDNLTRFAQDWDGSIGG